LRKIAVANQKGGCGKTTVSVNLASSLSFLNKRVLLIDLDPQGHSSLGLGIDTATIAQSLYDVFDETSENRPGLLDVKVIVSDCLHVVPSNIVLSALEQKLAGTRGRENKLYEKIESLGMSYDFLLIDCPPNLGLLTFNALRAANEVIVPVECSTFSLHGLVKVRETAELLKEVLNHSVRIKVVLNDFDARTRFSHKIQDELERTFPERLFRTVIHHSVRLKEAAAAGKPITEFDRSSGVFKNFMNLAAEVLEGESAPRSLLWSDPFAIEHLVPQGIDRDNVKKSVEGEQNVLLRVCAPEAICIQVAGDFNNWVPEYMRSPIKRNGFWRKLYHLPKGNYKYKFIIDGDWTCDPGNQRREPNPFGGFDSVLEVGTCEALAHGR